MDDLLNAVRRETERAMSGRYHTRTGLVTSYDPKTHSAKVMMKPDDVETGWLPIHTSHAGNGWGIVVGLTPGDGKKTGDQVEVTFGEGDLEQGRIIHRLHSDVDKPPTVQSGEILIQHQKGHYVFFDKDGNKTIYHNAGDAPQGGQPPQTGNGTYVKVDKDGNATVFSNKKTLTLDDGNGATHVHDGNGAIKRNAKKIDDTAASGDYNRTASSGNITDTANQLNHNGPTNVQGTLGVSQLLSANGGVNGPGFSLGGLLSSFTGGASISGLTNMVGGASIGGAVSMSGLQQFASDAAASAGGIGMNGLYLNGSQVMSRQT